MPKTRPAHERIKKLLSIIPWIVANPGSSVSSIADRFGLTEKELLDDLSIIYMVGLPPYTPDSLVDVEIDDDGGVFIRLADYFSRPLSLTATQALALLASSEALEAFEDPSSALFTGLQKLKSGMGMDDVEAIEVDLGELDSDLLQTLRKVIDNRQEASILYYSFGRDAVSKRRIVPWRLISDSGFWYMQSWCFTSGEERLFRVDRIEEVEVHNDRLNNSEPQPDFCIFNPTQGAPKVKLRLKPDALWVLEAYPYEEISSNPDGSVDITLVILAVPWLERLLLKLGDNVELISSESLEIKKLVSGAATRILAKYNSVN